MTIGRASAKAWRYVARDEGDRRHPGRRRSPAELFEALAVVYAELATRARADAPEDVSDDLPLDELLSELAGDR